MFEIDSIVAQQLSVHIKIIYRDTYGAFDRRHKSVCKKQSLGRRFEFISQIQSNISNDILSIPKLGMKDVFYI